MKKIISIGLFVIMAFMIYGCSEKSAVDTTEPTTIETETGSDILDSTSSDIGEIDDLEEELNVDELDKLAEDLDDFDW